MTRWIIFILIYLLLVIYGYQAVRTVTKQSAWYYLYFGIALLVLGNFIFQFTSVSEGRVLSPAKSYAFGFLLSFMALNLVLVPILLGEDLIRGFFSIYDRLVSTKDSFHIPSRRKFVSQVALGLAAIPFTSLLYGMYRGKYNFRVLN